MLVYQRLPWVEYTMSHHHTYYVTSSYIRCHIIISVFCPGWLPAVQRIFFSFFSFFCSVFCPGWLPAVQRTRRWHLGKRPGDAHRRTSHDCLRNRHRPLHWSRRVPDWQPARCGDTPEIHRRYTGDTQQNSFYHCYFWQPLVVICYVIYYVIYYSETCARFYERMMGSCSCATF